MFDFENSIYLKSLIYNFINFKISNTIIFISDFIFNCKILNYKSKINFVKTLHKILWYLIWYKILFITNINL